MKVLEDRDAWRATFEQGWLAHYEATGECNWGIYNRPRNSVAPDGPAIDLARSRLILISSAGAYLRHRQAPFDAADPLGDYSVRVLPTATAFSDIAFAHDHYDHAAVAQDPQVVLPLRHLEEMVGEGIIGELAADTVSFMGYQPVVTRVLDETIPAVLAAVAASGAKGALLVPA